MATRECRSGGLTLLEVLVTLVILAFGLLALVNLQIKLHMNESESYQRAQAVVLIQDMVNRMLVNPGNATGYRTSDADDGTADWVGPDGIPCGTFPAATTADVCAWQTLLAGSSVVVGGSSIGAMSGARGCIVEIQAANPTAGVCQPGLYRISVAWQGLYESAAPGDACATDANYGDDDGYRRVVSTLVSLGTPGCLPL